MHKKKNIIYYALVYSHFVFLNYSTSTTKKRLFLFTTNTLQVRFESFFDSLDFVFKKNQKKYFHV